MKFSWRFILAFLLLMLSYSTGGNAVNFSNCTSSLQGTSQLSESSLTLQGKALLNESSSSNFDKSQTFSVSDVELGFKTVSETYSYTNNFRLRRIIEFDDAVKFIMRKFSLLRENSLVLDQSKFYYSDKDSHYSVICSDYYVFALRHILI